MNPLLLTLHVIVSVLLIAVILLQPGAKGGGLGASFGGGGGANTAFGAQGAAPFLAKFTFWLAAGFMCTSLGIELYIVANNRSVLELKKSSRPAVQTPAPAPVVPVMPAPAAPAQK